MNIIVVDDERTVLNLLIEGIRDSMPNANIHIFQKTKEALEYASQNICDIAFCNVELKGMDGVALAKKLKMINPKVNIIFVTAFQEYLKETMSLHVSGYIIKPVTKEAVRDELENLRYPVPLFEFGELRVQTFGNFEVFRKEEPVHFQYSKTKELFAYLIDRNGAMSQNGELIAVLWGDDETVVNKQSYLRKLKKDLIETLCKVGSGDIIVKQRGCLGIIPDQINCDYYEWLQGNIHAINAFRGEYMSQYSWAELTLGEIEKVL